MIFKLELILAKKKLDLQKLLEVELKLPA